MEQSTQAFTLNVLRDETHKNNQKWWHDLKTGQPIQRSYRNLLALVHSELSEALEGERKNLFDDKLPDRKMAEVEMADATIRLLDYAGGFGLDLDKTLKSHSGINRSATSLDTFVTKWTPRTTDRGEWIFFLHSRVNSIGNHNPTNDVDKDVAAATVAIAILEIIRYCQACGYDLHGAYVEKTAYNLTRADHSHAERLKENGKKF